MSPGYIIDYTETRYHVTISYNKTWNARMKALMKIFGDWESSYETLPQYLEALKSSNPGNVTATYFDRMSYRMVQFRHVFRAFGPFIEGFLYYRPFPALTVHICMKNIKDVC